MPKAQKSSQNVSGAKSKQITDFFPRKTTFSQDISLNVLSPTASGQKDAKQSLVKENTKPHSRNLRSKVHSTNESSLNPTTTSGTQHPHSPLSTKPTHITSPIQPPAKRLRSQSVISNKQTKRAKNILCESKFEEGKMEVEDDSVVYVPPDTTVRNPPFLQVSFLDPTQTENPHVVASSNHQLEVNSIVPSSLSEEKELELSLPDKKDIEAVKEAVDRWRYQATSPSSLPKENNPADTGADLHGPSTAFETDWNTARGSISNPMSSQPNVNITSSIPAPPTHGPDSIHLPSPLKILDKESKTNQIIEAIRARAYEQSRSKQPSSPVSTISSLDSSDEEDELNAFDFGLKNNCKSESPLKVKTPIKPTRYNLRKPVAKTALEKPKPIPNLDRDSSPSPPAKRKPVVNPLDALLKEKRVVNGKNVMRSADREAQLRDLANMNLNDDSDSGVVGLKGSGDSLPLIAESDGNPFIDDDQKQQVMEILEGDKVIKDEEEHLRQQGKVGVPLWGNSESSSMDSCDGLPRLDYQGSDPTLQSFAQIVNQGDCDLVDLVIQSGALQLANYTEGGFNVINYLIGLAFSQRVDGLDVSAFQLLSTLLPTIGTPVPLLGHILLTLRALGAQLSLLERLGWTIDNDPRNTISATERLVVVERLVFCIMDFAKSGCLHQREVPDVMLVLLLLGIEPSSSHEMRLQVTRAMNEICQPVGEENVVEAEVETATCNKVLHLVQPYSLQNKLFVLDLLASGGGRIARIARWVAHAMLTGKSTLLPLHYSELPLLSELVTVIESTSRDESRTVGKFEIHEATDYVDLACWTHILAIAVSDIPHYVKQEDLGKGMSSPMKSPSKEKDQSLILTLHDKLYKIHGRIQDTRAAHLDRSRTKAVIFQTAFRILYQYQAITQYRRKNNHDIQSYFRKK